MVYNVVFLQCANGDDYFNYRSAQEENLQELHDSP